MIRHGESAGNVARLAASQAGRTHIDIEGRDVDVPLSDLGIEQAEALGRWFAAMPEEERPEIVLVSPYLRARTTAERIHAAGGVKAGPQSFVVDERLREKEFGVLDRLTTLGIEQTLPEQFEFRRLLGKFYHRPPGGESSCAVLLRTRALLDTVVTHHAGQRVTVVATRVVVVCLPAVSENHNEVGIIGIEVTG